MDASRFDSLAREIGTSTRSRRTLIAGTVAGLVGLVGFSFGSPFIQGTDAKARCKRSQKACKAGCCKKKFPVCCNRHRYCCKRGYYCCRTSFGLGCCRK